MIIKAINKQQQNNRISVNINQSLLVDTTVTYAMFHHSEPIKTNYHTELKKGKKII